MGEPEPELRRETKVTQPPRRGRPAPASQPSVMSWANASQCVIHELLDTGAKPRRRERPRALATSPGPRPSRTPTEACRSARSTMGGRATADGVRRTPTTPCLFSSLSGRTFTAVLAGYGQGRQAPTFVVTGLAARPGRPRAAPVPRRRRREPRRAMAAAPSAPGLGHSRANRGESQGIAGLLRAPCAAPWPERPWRTRRPSPQPAQRHQRSRPSRAGLLPRTDSVNRLL